MTEKLIGFIDLDLLYTKTLSQPNYELSVVATYYKNKGVNVRLVMDMGVDNLRKYDKIYVFKSHKYSPMPAQLIKDYYKLNVEEYGDGFIGRPLHPDIPDLMYINPDTDIYKPLINFLSKPDTKSKYKLTNKTWFDKYRMVKCFYVIDGEILIRQMIPESINKVLIYDDPLLFFTTDKGVEVFNKLVSNKSLQFATPLDISKVSDDSYETIMMSPKLASLRKNIYASESNENLKNFLKWIEVRKNEIKPARLSIILQDHDDYVYYLLNGLRVINHLPKRLGNKLKIYPRINGEIRNKHYLLAYFYSWQRGKIGSFYEYVVWRTYKKEITKAQLNGKIDAHTINYLFKNYGMRGPIVRLEEIMYNNREAEDLIMMGGKSYYGQERNKYSYIGGTPQAFGGTNFQTRPNRIATKTADILNRRSRK